MVIQDKFWGTVRSSSQGYHFLHCEYLQALAILILVSIHWLFVYNFSTIFLFIGASVQTSQILGSNLLSVFSKALIMHFKRPTC